MAARLAYHRQMLRFTLFFLVPARCTVVSVIGRFLTNRLLVYDKLDIKFSEPSIKRDLTVNSAVVRVRNEYKGKNTPLPSVPYR